MILVRFVQQKVFDKEFRDIKAGNRSSGNKLLNLNPFIDTEGLIRVGGCIENARVAFDRRHQIVLPEKHPLTDAIINAMHVEHLYIGRSQTALLAYTRKKVDSSFYSKMHQMFQNKTA